MTTFDADALLAEYGDEELIAELVQLWLDQAAPQMQAIDAAIAAGDATGLKRAAHKMRGTIATFGAAEAVSVAEQLEAIGVSGACAGATALSAQLATHVRALCDGASAWLATQPQAH